ncbi:MAG: hypothetical protein HFF93_10005 [Oscillibacter sp.]|nr:hypothetical protein [Oscillibacter sp.]
MTISDADFKRMVNFIQSSYGIDLSQKKQLITSRLSPALKKLGYGTFSDFVNHLLDKKENDEVTLVLNKLTTNYTFFMREKEHLDYFCNNIIPEIVRRHERDKTLAIWSAGCSSGEEPYNITMFLYDYLGSRAKDWDMIYFDQPTKDALVRRFYDATVPSGYLLISASENLSQNAPYRRLATATFQK